MSQAYICFTITADTIVYSVLMHSIQRTKCSHYRQKNQTKFSIGTSFFVVENLLFKEDFAMIRKDSVGHCVSELCPGIGRKNPALYREATYKIEVHILSHCLHFCIHWRRDKKKCKKIPLLVPRQNLAPDPKLDPDTSLSRILIFTDPGSRIQKQEQKRGVKKFVVIPFFVATNFTKL